MIGRMSDIAKLGAVIDGREGQHPKAARARIDRLPTKPWRNALLLSLLLDGSPRKQPLRIGRADGAREGD